MIILFVYIVVFIHMSLFWLWYRYTNNPSVVDVGWASGLTVSGLIYLLSQPFGFRTFVLATILFLWGARLGGFLWYTRIRKGEVDKRYLSLSEDWKIAKPLGFYLNFQLQGIFIMVISLPWYFASLLSSSTLSNLDYLAICIALIALICETIADKELRDFKKKPGKNVCDQGFWNYSRHPNYFFEWVIWCAFYLFGITHTYGILGILSPLSLYWLMTKITGPMTETGSIKSRGEAYKKYQKTTPMFFPDLRKLLNTYKN